MKKITKKRALKIGMVACDLLIVPAMLLCEKLSDYMLSTESVCSWVKLGGRCITCGGTHFVNSFLNGKFIEAFHHNQLLFLMTLYVAVSFIFLNLFLLFDLKPAKKALKIMYNIPTLIIFLTLMLLFLVIRNIPLWTKIFELLTAKP